LTGRRFVPDDKIKMTVALSCKKCGNAGVSVPDDPSEGDMITCPACGAELGTVDELNAKIREGATEKARELLQKTIKDALGGSKNIKLNF
jgi:hypothetical protein